KCVGGRVVVKTCRGGKLYNHLSGWCERSMNIGDCMCPSISYIPTGAPNVSLSLHSDVIAEGRDTYMDCYVKANPRAYKIDWLKDGSELYHNVSQGILVSNNSLVLQNVRRVEAGIYTCRATNDHGTTTSNALQLRVE
ncbi:unnamed protein product, partial [Meganyctiphanes norvegica]